jgi:hypothetical protein
MARLGFVHVSVVVQGSPVLEPPLLELDMDGMFVVLVDEQAAPTAANPEAPARRPSTAA